MFTHTPVSEGRDSCRVRETHRNRWRAVRFTHPTRPLAIRMPSIGPIYRYIYRFAPSRRYSAVHAKAYSKRFALVKFRRRELRDGARMSSVWKEAVLGNQVTHRGKAKYLGGVGTKMTGISRRVPPELAAGPRHHAQRHAKTLRVCTQCIRSGAVVKRIHSPFKLPKAASEVSRGQCATTASLRFD